MGGEDMRLDKSEAESVASGERRAEREEARQEALTPVRRAALAALEREFRDLLQPR